MSTDMYSFEKFKKYKKDWSYPTFLRNQAFIAPGSQCKGRRVTFQTAMKATLIVGQCFGLNPVLGICEADASKLRFTFRSWRCAYTVASILAQSFLVFLCLMNLFKDTDSSLGSNTSIIFHTTSCLTTIAFFRIAMKWPRLCQQISKTEAADPNVDTTLTKKCNFSVVIVLSLALLEHTLSDLFYIAIAMDCAPNLNLYQGFVLRSYPWIFYVVPYNHFSGVLSQFLNIQCTFNWNFADLFVICMSWYLASRLEQVNRRIVAVKGKYVPPSFWRKMREDYNRATYLVKQVDDIIGGVIFISFANNLFFICLQLLHTLAEGIKATPRCRLEEPDKRPWHGYEQPVYFAFSFVFLVLRSLAVSLTAARVHTASQEPAQALYSVSSSAYCIEIQRFLDQIHGETVALSGLQFFNVKRGLVLTIAATIVTYELVLMQFTGVTPTSSPPI